MFNSIIGNSLSRPSSFFPSKPSSGEPEDAYTGLSIVLERTRERAVPPPASLRLLGCGLFMQVNQQGVEETPRTPTLESLFYSVTSSKLVITERMEDKNGGGEAHKPKILSFSGTSSLLNPHSLDDGRRWGSRCSVGGSGPAENPFLRVNSSGLDRSLYCAQNSCCHGGSSLLMF